MKRPLVTAFKPHNSGLAKLFGSLEAEIIELIWVCQPASAREIFEALRDQGRRLAYGTVKTVLDRLVHKQFLDRSTIGDQYVYSAKLDREEFTKSAIGEIVESLMASFGDPVYAQFVDRMQRIDRQQLEHLLARIDQAEADKMK